MGKYIFRPRTSTSGAVPLSSAPKRTAAGREPAAGELSSLAISHRLPNVYVTGDPVPRLDDAQLGHFQLRPLNGEGAARREGAAHGQMDHIRRHALDGDQPIAPWLVHA